MIHIVIHILLYSFSGYFIKTLEGFSIKQKQYKHTQSTNGIHDRLSNHYNRYRRNSNFNYDYDDWDSNEQTLQKESIKTTTAITTKPSANIDTIVPTIADTSAATDYRDVENVTESISNLTNGHVTKEDTDITDTDIIASITTDTVTDRPITVSIINTSLPLIAISEEAKNLLKIFVTTNAVSETSSPPTFNLETYFPGTTDDILDHIVTNPAITKNPFLKEIEENSKKRGYFTSSLIILFKILTEMNRKEISPLLATLNSKIQRLNADDNMLIFGGMAAEVFQAMIQMLATEPVDVMHNHFKYVEYALENRHAVLKEDVNDLIDIVDTVYIYTDLEDIANVLTDIKTYPNGTALARDIADAALRAFMYTPFRRIHGTAREKMLVVELNSVIKKRLYPGQDLHRK